MLSAAMGDLFGRSLFVGIKLQQWLFSPKPCRWKMISGEICPKLKVGRPPKSPPPSLSNLILTTPMPCMSGLRKIPFFWIASWISTKCTICCLFKRFSFDAYLGQSCCCCLGILLRSKHLPTMVGRDPWMKWKLITIVIGSTMEERPAFLIKIFKLLKCHCCLEKRPLTS